MHKVSRKERQLQALMKRYLKAPSLRWDDMPDPRSRRGRRWRLPVLLDALFLGALACCRALRDVETLSAQLVGRGGGLGRTAPRRVPDTTLDGLLRKAQAGPFVAKLHAQVREMKRSGGLKPTVGLPCGVVTIDGKGLATMDRKVNAYCQHHEQNGVEYWLQRAVRAVVTSSEAKVCVHQAMIPAHTNDMGVFEAAYDELLEAYGASDLFEIVTCDAGFTSLHNATLVHESERYYVFGLKDNQPALHAEAKQLLLDTVLSRGEPAEASTDWEKRDGGWMRRSLWRSRGLNGRGGWTHLEQTWMVVQEKRSEKGEPTISEIRFFVTNLPWARLSALQCLHVVRGHWGIENDSNWSLDALWKEDHGAWCTQNNAVEVLGLIRLMACNILQQLRQRHLPARSPDGKRRAATRWRDLFAWVYAVLLSESTGQDVTALG